jgi:PAS domain S-box-containing protein
MKKRLDEIISQLYKLKPPLKDWRFWTIQAFSVVIVVVHYYFESFGGASKFGDLYFVPIILLIIPIIIAALYFGSIGAITTALWVVALTIPNLVLGQSGLERIGEVFQMAVLVAIAVFMGRQVDHERSLRHKVEDTSTALIASEAKYRSLFNTSPAAILALNQDNIIIDANPSAGVLFGKSPGSLKNMSINDLIGTGNEPQQFISDKGNNRWEFPFNINLKNGSEVYLEPKLTRLSDHQGNSVIQVVLRDITEERRRQAGLKAYTASIIKAQEEERQHIARELHDETLQDVSLLCRQLKGIELDEALPSSIIDDLNKSRDMAEKVVTELRNFTRSLRPPILDDLGLVPSLRRLLLDLTDRSGINGQLKIIGGEYRLPQDVEWVCSESLRKLYGTLSTILKRPMSALLLLLLRIPRLSRWLMTVLGSQCHLP